MYLTHNDKGEKSENKNIFMCLVPVVHEMKVSLGSFLTSVVLLGERSV